MGTARGGGKSAAAALESTPNPVAHRVFRDFQPDRQIKLRVKPIQNVIKTLRLRQSAGKTVKNEAVASMQAQPILDQLHDDLVGYQATTLSNFSSFQSQ